MLEFAQCDAVWSLANPPFCNNILFLQSPQRQIHVPARSWATAETQPLRKLQMLDFYRELPEWVVL